MLEPHQPHKIPWFGLTAKGAPPAVCAGRHLWAKRKPYYCIAVHAMLWRWIYSGQKLSRVKKSWGERESNSQSSGNSIYWNQTRYLLQWVSWLLVGGNTGWDSSLPLRHHPVWLTDESPLRYRSEYSHPSDWLARASNLRTHIRVTHWIFFKFILHRNEKAMQVYICSPSSTTGPPWIVLARYRGVAPYECWDLMADDRETWSMLIRYQVLVVRRNIKETCQFIYSRELPQDTFTTGLTRLLRACSRAWISRTKFCIVMFATIGPDVSGRIQRFPD